MHLPACSATSSPVGQRQELNLNPILGLRKVNCSSWQFYPYPSSGEPWVGILSKTTRYRCYLKTVVWPTRAPHHVACTCRSSYICSHASPAMRFLLGNCGLHALPGTGIGYRYYPVCWQPVFYPARLVMRLVFVQVQMLHVMYSSIMMCLSCGIYYHGGTCVRCVVFSLGVFNTPRHVNCACTQGCSGTSSSTLSYRASAESRSLPRFVVPARAMPRRPES